MTLLRVYALIAITACSFTTFSQRSDAAIEATLPVSAQLGTSITADLFPLLLTLEQGKLYLTEPQLLFIDSQRISLQVRFQAFDHRPEEGIAISERGTARVSGVVDYDRSTREVLLHDPQIDNIEFDRDNALTQDILAQLNSAWSSQVNNPVRSEIPPHAYTLPFRDNIEAITYDGKAISFKVAY